MCVCMCMYVCVCMCMYVCVCVCMCVYVCLQYVSLKHEYRKRYRHCMWSYIYMYNYLNKSVVFGVRHMQLLIFLIVSSYLLLSHVN